MTNKMYSVAEVAAMIKAGKRLMLAGEEALLTQLPEGDWIGGTASAFMADCGGCECNDGIWVDEVPSYVLNTRRVVYDINNIKNIYTESYEHGYTILILPFGHDICISYALHAPEYQHFAMTPLAGWVASVPFDELTTRLTAVFNGSPVPIRDKGVALHVELPDNKIAEVSAINLLKQGDGDDIEVQESGYSIGEVIINGKKCNFADYIRKYNPDGNLPLVANYFGTGINASIIRIDPDRIYIAAPVFKGVKYRLAAPVGDYVKEFAAIVPEETTSDRIFSCNCSLNYLAGKLKGRKTGIIGGPFTGGEICYQLVNQTMVLVEVYDA